jgi:hypothetical protein
MIIEVEEGQPAYCITEVCQKLMLLWQIDGLLD